jgi:hypothetical protein
VNLSTPKSAVVTFFAGIRAGDANAIAESILAPDPAREKLASMYAQAVVKREALRQTILSKFGQDAVPSDDWIPTEAQINAAMLINRGDRVTVRLPSGMGDALKVGGKWRLPFLVDAFSDQQVDKTSATLHDYITRLSAAVADVNAGKIKSADAAPLFARFPFPALATTK